MADTGGLLDKVKAKLVETKQKWANEGRLLTGESAAPTLRLPPGQREVKNWPVLDLGIQPEIAPDAWRLEIDGLVETPLVLDYAGFQALPQVRMVSDIHCVTQWSRFDNAWEGVATRALLDRVRPKPEAGFVLQTAHDGYTTNLPLADFAGEDVLLAHRWEGAPISAAHRSRRARSANSTRSVTRACAMSAILMPACSCSDANSVARSSRPPSMSASRPTTATCARTSSP